MSLERDIAAMLQDEVKSNVNTLSLASQIVREARHQIMNEYLRNIGAILGGNFAPTDHTHEEYDG